MIKERQEPSVISFLYEEEEKRGLETIRLSRLMKTEGNVGKLKAQQPEIDPARLGWPARREFEMTMDATTQLATHKVVDPTRWITAKNFGIHHRRNVIVATDTIPVTTFNPTQLLQTAKENLRPPEEQYFQVFVELGPTTSSEASGRLSAYPMKKKSDYVQALQDFIRNRFIPSRMWIDGAKEEDSNLVQQIYRRMYMKDAIKSEPGHQYQNPCEVLGVSRIKRLWRRLEVLGWTYYKFILPLKFAKYKLNYVINLLNHRAYVTGSTSSLMYGKTPIERSDGITPDMSQFRFGFLQLVVYWVKSAWPKTQLRIGRSLGPSISGTFLTQYVLTQQMSIISVSAVESVENIKLRFGSKSTSESEGGKKVRINPNIDKPEQGELAAQLDEFEEADEATFNQRKEQHEEFDKLLEEEEELRRGARPVAKELGTGEGGDSESTDAIIDQAIVEMETDDPNPTEKQLGEEPEKEEHEEEETSSEEDDEIQDHDYQVHKIINMNDPESNQQCKVFQGYEEDMTMTKKGMLSLEVEWKGHKGWNTFEPFNRLREDAPELVARYIRKQLGDKPFKYQHRSLRNAVRWANEYLATENEDLKAYIQKITASGYYDSDETSEHVEHQLKVKISVIKERDFM
jgi:hypothetical protein